MAAVIEATSIFDLRSVVRTTRLTVFQNFLCESLNNDLTECSNLPEMTNTINELKGRKEVTAALDIVSPTIVDVTLQPELVDNLWHSGEIVASKPHKGLRTHSPIFPE